MPNLCRLSLLLLCTAAVYALDLSHATVASSQRLPTKPFTVLTEEVQKRAHVTWTAGIASQDATVVRLSVRGTGKPDGYLLTTDRRSVTVAGNDQRGLLFGVGRLLRLMQMSPGRVTIAEGIHIDTAPAMALRGHQLGYRPKTNSYDGWDLPQWEQYIRELAIFGTNAIELIPPRSDDAATSPHFPRPPIEMMRGVSQIAADYGLDVWIWYPAMDQDYGDPATVERAVREWGDVFRQLPRVDAVFVPGGDPGHTRPKHLLALLERETEALHRSHPRAQMWVSPQSFNQQWLEEFLQLLKAEPRWLSGVAYGPQTRIGLHELRQRIPARYPIRYYPDITHTLRAQFPVPDWDLAYALTEGREPINPRPTDYARAFQAARADTIGFITYSEGCNDDVNKFVWSALGWDPDEAVVDILREYGQTLIGPGYRDTFAQGLLALERNWRGPLLTNDGVMTTLAQWQDMERDASPQDRLNWRFQQALYRAYYDAYDHERLAYEHALETEAVGRLREGAAMGEAERILQRAVERPVAADLRARAFALAEALYQSIRMQLSVPRYQAIAVGRGANLDSIDVPLNNRLWWQAQFGALHAMNDERARMARLRELVNWTDPGPGGFYDDLGNPANQPHLVRGAAFTGFGISYEHPGLPWRTSWLTHAEALYDQPLTLRYTGLDPTATYRVRVTYAGEGTSVEARLTANGTEVHPFRKPDRPVQPVEFPLPPGLRELTLEWTKPAGMGGNGRGAQVSEVWVMRER